MHNFIERPIETFLSDPHSIFDKIKFGHQAFFDTKHRISLNIGVVGIKDVGDQRLEPVGLKDVVQIRWPKRFAPQCRQQLGPPAHPTGSGKIWALPL